MKFRCTSNAAIKNVKIARKKINFSSKIFSTKLPFFLNILILKNIRYIFRFWNFFPSFWLLICLFRSNNKAMNQLFPTSCGIHKKITKIMSTLYFETPPYSQIMTPQSKFFFYHTVLNYFFGKIHQRTIMQLQN